MGMAVALCGFFVCLVFCKQTLFHQLVELLCILTIVPCDVVMVSLRQ